MAAPVSTTYSQSTPSQQSFTSHYDLDDPLSAMTSYSKLLHQHTKRQMEQSNLTSSSHRRSSPSDGAVSAAGSLSSEDSVDSVDSLQQ